MDVKNKVCINFASKDFSSKDFSLTRDFIAGADAGKKKKNEALNYSVREKYGK